MLDRSILTKGMRRWFLFIAISSTFLVANGFYLWFFESRAVSHDYILSYYYIGNVLAHLVVGLLFGIPFLGFVLSHLKVTWKHRNSRSRWLGMILTAAALLSLATGIYLMIAGAVRDNYWILIIHIVVAMAGVILFSLHRWASSRAEKLTLANLKEVGVILGVFVLLSGIHIISQSDLVQKAQAAAQPISFMPSPSQIEDNKLIPAEQLSNVEYCKQCHPDAYAQWKSSAHAHSSFSNIFYARSVAYMEQTADPNRVRWCAGCHDPAILFSGQMQNITVDSDFTKNKYASASITCITCHSMQTAPIRGNGGYVIAPPVQYPFAYSTNPFLKFVNRLLIYVKPEPHRRAFLKPFHKTSQFCGTCHKVSVPVAVNDYRWQRGQDEYDAWDNSGVSGHSVRSFYSPPKPFSTCSSCHMPKVQSADPGSVDGLVHYHSFPAANTALAYVSNDTSWLARTIAFLKANRVTVDIFAVKRGNDVYAPLDAPAANVVPGETLLLDVVVRNKSIGHGFPGGTVDAQQPWLELIGKDANGNEFFHSGWVDSTDQHVDSTAHFFHARILTRDGELITTRGVHKWVATLYKHIIGPGSADVIHYKIHIPQDVGSAVTFVAKVHYKKFDEAFSEFVYEGKQMPQLPDVVMAENTRTIQTAATASPASAYTAKPEDRDRFNDYGIGSFFEEGERDASWAWKRTTQIDPNYADGYINLARIDLKEGYIEQMDTDLINAERVKPGYDKTKFFRGNLDKLEGKYPEALSELQQVYNDYPFERETIDLIGRIYYLQNEYTTAIQWYQKELDIDPEDKTPHYNMMLCYRAMGNKDEATNEEDAWRTYKEDEFQNEVTQKYRQTHESANNEAQPIHYHEDSRALINF